MATQFKNIKLPQLSEKTRIGIRKVNFMNVLKKIGWPLFLVFDDSLMDKLEKYQYEEIDESSVINSIVFDYCNDDFVDKLLSYWEESNVINRNRLPILSESVDLYKSGSYYGCVSSLLCQLNGIITDTYEMQKSYGKDFNIDDIKSAYKHYNPNKTIPNKINKNSEKTQLLWFVSDADEGIIYWIKAIEYIYGIALTSEDSMIQSNHPCRNKICHGIQLNFGTKEHGLKAILTVYSWRRV